MELVRKGTVNARQLLPASTTVILRNNLESLVFQELLDSGRLDPSKLIDRKDYPNPQDFDLFQRSQSEEKLLEDCQITNYQKKILLLPCIQTLIFEDILTVDDVISFRDANIRAWFDQHGYAVLSNPDVRNLIKEGKLKIQDTYYHTESTNPLYYGAIRKLIRNDIITMPLLRQMRLSMEETEILCRKTQRLIDGEVTIDAIIDSPVTGGSVRLNTRQSARQTSLRLSAHNSVVRLFNRYEHEVSGDNLKKVIDEMIAYTRTLLSGSQKNEAAKRYIEETTSSDDIDITPFSKPKITRKQLLASTFLAIHDKGHCTANLDDARLRFVEGLYEIQRGYNLSEEGLDTGGPDERICLLGECNKLIEKLVGIHPDAKISFVTLEMASLKLPVVVREEVSNYISNICTVNKLLLLYKMERQGVDAIWNSIFLNIAVRIFDEFHDGHLFHKLDGSSAFDASFPELIDSGRYIKVDVFVEKLKQDRLCFFKQLGIDSFLFGVVTLVLFCCSNVAASLVVCFTLTAALFSLFWRNSSYFTLSYLSKNLQAFISLSSPSTAECLDFSKGKIPLDLFFSSIKNQMWRQETMGEVGQPAASP